MGRLAQRQELEKRPTRRAQSSGTRLTLNSSTGMVSTEAWDLRYSEAVARAASANKELRATWRAHAHWKGSPAEMIAGFHDGFLRGLRWMRREVLQGAKAETLALEFRSIASALHHHHTAEERLLFPALTRHTDASPDPLVDDHENLTRAIDALQSALDSRAANADLVPLVLALDDVLIEHLAREEAHAMPMFLSRPPSEAWALVHG